MARNPSLTIGVALVFALLLTAAIGPMVIQRDPLTIDLNAILAAPGGGHLLGCDALGRDMFARALWGGRLSLAVSSLVVAMSLAIGSLIGGVAALSGGRIDETLMRAVDVL